MGQADRQNRNARRERELEAEVRALRKKTGGERRGDRAAKKIHRHNFQNRRGQVPLCQGCEQKGLRGEVMPNCWKSLGAGTTPGCGVGKAPGKRPIRPCSGNWCVCTRNTLPWGWTACTTCLKPRLSLFPGKGAPADEGRRHPLPAKEGLQSHHQLPPQLPHRAKPAPTPVHFQPPQPSLGGATSPTSPPGKAGCISPLSKTCAPRKL